MKIIIAGAGNVGTHLAKLLSLEKQDIILMDDDEDNLSMISNSYDLMTVTASPTSINGLKEAGITEADLFVAVTPDENGNFTVELSGLTKGVTYYYCSFVTLQDKLSYYGNVKSFTTTDAQIATADAATVTPVSVMLGGTLNGVSDLIESSSSSLAYGVVLSTTKDEEAIRNGKQFAGVSTGNSYNVSVNTLIPGTTYYYMAYMKLPGNDSYGEMKEFTTAQMETQFVDLGLSVEWANCNLGATSTEELGGLYGWGDISGLYTSLDTEQYGHENDIHETEFDICTNAGIGRMPSFAEIRELTDNCKKEWTSVNGVNGYRFTASNGNSIFLPAAGSRVGYETAQSGTAGAYWSGSIEASTPTYAYSLGFSANDLAWGTALRYEGLSIRPVKKPDIASVVCDNSKLLYGELEEGSGKFRIEMYNEYGGSKENPSINIDKLEFSQNCVIKFRLSGLNFKEDANGKYRAGLQ